MKLVLFANTDWYLYNFRRSLALSMQAMGHEVLLISPPGPYAQRLADLGLRWIAAPMKRSSLNPWKEARLLIWLMDLLRRERPDVLHSFTIKCVVYGGIVGRIVGVARVNAVAGVGYVFIGRSLKAILLRPLVRQLMRFANGGSRARLILQNPDDVAAFSQYSMASEEITRLIRGSGVDCTQFQPPAGGHRSKDEPLRVLLAARMLWDKGIREFVEAARILRDQGRVVVFMLAGIPDPGNPRAIPEQTLQKWHHSGDIEWLGHVEDMPGLMASVDVVALPSSYGEGLPRSLIEAAACGRALIAADVPGCREVISDGVDGLLVPAGAATPLAEAIARFADDPALAKKLGGAARVKALREFDDRLIVKRTISVYHEIYAKT